MPTSGVSASSSSGAALIRSVSAAAARGKDGLTYVALTNVDPNKPAMLTMTIAGASATQVSGRVLTSPTIQSYNDFAHPEVVRPVAFTGASLSGDTLRVELPAHAVVVLTLR